MRKLLISDKRGRGNYAINSGELLFLFFFSQFSCMKGNEVAAAQHEAHFCLVKAYGHTLFHVLHRHN